MVWGKAFMLPLWSNAFDTLHQHPPGSQNLKEEHSTRRVKKGTKKRLWNLIPCVCVHSKSPACCDHTPCAVSVFSRLPVRVVGCEIGSLCSSAPESCFHRFFSSSAHHHLSLHCNLHLSISLWDSDLAVAFFHTPPFVSVSPFLSLSLSFCPPAYLPHSAHLSHHLSPALSASHLPFLEGSFV